MNLKHLIGRAEADEAELLEKKPIISDFLTIQSFTNFAVMTGGITAAWVGLKAVAPWASTRCVPYTFAFIWAIISLMLSWEGFKDKDSKLIWSKVAASVFLGVINALILGGAVVGAISTAAE